MCASPPPSDTYAGDEVCLCVSVSPPDGPSAGCDAGGDGGTGGSGHGHVTSGPTSGPQATTVDYGNSAWRRTAILIEKRTSPGQDLFIRGGIGHDQRPGRETYSLLLQPL